MVFQSYALWPHLLVIENVMYPALRRGAARVEAERAARAVLATVRCEHLADRYPGELSGGQQQRIALARAMVARPSLLLFDEPLSNLDAGLRRGLRDELARLHREIGFTGIYVTHDQSEALALGTRLAVMEGGRIVQLGTPADLYERPANEFVARFFGAHLISGRVSGDRIESAAGLFAVSTRPGDGPVQFGFMPHSARIEADVEGPLEVAAAMYLGSHWELRLSGGGHELLVIRPTSESPPAAGTRVRLVIDPEKLFVFKQ
jgi:ABC-type sugar transport system ATPase subunit